LKTKWKVPRTIIHGDYYISETKIEIRFSEGAPNIEAREITDMGRIVRAVDDEPGGAT
jgi:hypothetical protein